MEPFRTNFIGLTLLFPGLAFRKLYLAPQVCAPGTPCANPDTLKRQRITFWIVATLLLARPEIMLVDACQFYYECGNCEALLRPNPSDCCAFCSFGSLKCLPMQQQSGSCG
jgi:hypothetical protein